jgi:Protein of unknown function (DUF3152)
VLEDRDHGAATLRSRDDYVDDEERYAHEYEQGPGRLRRSIRTFVGRYGWRAYALPILTVVTVVILVTMAEPSHRSSTQAPAPSAAQQTSSPGSAATRSGSSVLKSDQGGANVQNEALASDALPAGPAYTVQGDGTFRVLPGTTPVVGRGTLHRYTIEVENGITGVDLGAFTRLVDRSLDDPRSWTGHHSGIALQRVDSGPADFHITLTSSMTVRSLCGYELRIETSCWAPDKGNRVVENVARWVRGDVNYIGDLYAYHQYMINHESGHALGHIHSHVCLSNGLAPVMMQQTIGLKSVSGKICQANPWPYPAGATNAPGAEAPDTPQNNPRIPN